MLLSWALTEVVRYAFYARTLLGSEPKRLLWLRYTTFFVLYPTGATSEALLIYTTLPARAWRLPDYARAGLFAIWWPGASACLSFRLL